MPFLLSGMRLVYELAPFPTLLYAIFWKIYYYNIFIQIHIGRPISFLPAIIAICFIFHCFWLNAKIQWSLTIMPIIIMVSNFWIFLTIPALYFKILEIAFSMVFIPIYCFICVKFLILSDKLIKITNAMFEN